jgi:putative transposase
MMQQQGEFRADRMCELAQVSRAGFYRDWLQAAPQEAEMAIRDAVQKAALDTHRRNGYRPVLELVRRAGFAVSENRVRRIMREDNLLAVRRRKFVVTTDSGHDFQIFPNLAQHVVLTDVNQLWVADITYVRLLAEFVFLAVVVDAFSRKVVGWALGRTLQASLPLLALNRALEARRPGRGLVHHSDRGSQYACDDYVRRLEQAGAIISMSRPARPWENGKCESFLKTLKAEEIEAGKYRTMEELELNIKEFIESFYNTKRLHSALNYLSPEEFEAEHELALQKRLPTLPVALSFRRHKEIYPDVQKQRKQ